MKSSPRALPAVCKHTRGRVSATACAHQPGAALAAHGSSLRGPSLLSSLCSVPRRSCNRAVAPASRSRVQVPTCRPRPEEPSPLPIPEPCPPLTQRGGSLEATEHEKSTVAACCELLQAVPNRAVRWQQGQEESNPCKNLLSAHCPARRGLFARTRVTMVLEFTKTLCPQGGSRCLKDQSPGVATSSSPPASPERRLFCPGSLAQLSSHRQPR